MSATNTGTPADESASVMTCSVFVLPVPVAPATSPWRFIIASGRPTCADGVGVSASTRAPRWSISPANVYPAVTLAAHSARPTWL
jgi:hypothetical protein